MQEKISKIAMLGKFAVCFFLNIKIGKSRKVTFFLYKFQALLEQNGLSVEVEVRPRYLVADTNCFIDYLPELKLIASTTAPHSPEPAYILNVPLIGKSFFFLSGGISLIKSNAVTI